jgi:biopolymer transport protein ExbD
MVSPASPRATPSQPHATNRPASDISDDAAAGRAATERPMAHDLDDGEDLAESHEINVTPFIDVILVLLIIFMVAAPLATVEVKVDLPAASAAAAPSDVRPIYFTIKADRSLQLDFATIEASALAATLDEITGGDRSVSILVRADETASYDSVMEGLNTLRATGYTSFALMGAVAGS